MPDPGAAGPRGGGSITVGEVHRPDGREAVHVLALSFADEPALSSILGGSRRRRYRVLVPFMWAGLRSYPGSTEIHGAWLDGRLVGVGLRMPPGAWPLRRSQELRGVVWGLLGSLPMLVAFPRAVRMFPRMAEQQRRHPRDRPHWYLWCVGVHPSFRRRGVGTALARFVIDKADAGGVGCYLETYGDGTEALYRRLGFEVRDRWEIGPSAPPARTMWREPSSAKADVA